MSLRTFHVPFFISLLVAVYGIVFVVCFFPFLPATAAGETHVVIPSHQEGRHFLNEAESTEHEQGGQTERFSDKRRLQDVETVSGGAANSQYPNPDIVANAAAPNDKPNVDGTFTDTLHQAADDAMEALNSVTQQLSDMGLEPWQITLIVIAAGAAVLCLACCCMRCLCRNVCCCPGK
ncbi:putative transmembrane protein [Toxoplasma gondii MAS]|uniref:Putative transmembrane protein n=1 Tax=Toxoplasma gondii MAS TaxID=943118 RepID=A0A086QSL2_TOXGO|nr:putative transmembrane protein [Toxoplasma gondii MAS]